MNIYEATKECLKNEDSGMARKNWKTQWLFLKPANDLSGVVVYMNGKPLYEHWQPNADDLIADDWNVYVVSVFN